MRHISLLVGLALPVLACNEPAHWSKGDPAASAEVTAERPAAPAPEARTDAEAPTTPEVAAPAAPDAAADPVAGAEPIPGEQVPGDAARAGLDDVGEPGQLGAPGQPAPGPVAQHPAPGTTHGDASAPGMKTPGTPGTTSGLATTPSVPGAGAPGSVAQGQTPGRTGQGQSAPGQTAQGQTAPGQTAQGQTAQGQTAQGQTAAGAQGTPAAPAGATSDPRLVVRGPVTQGGLVVAQVQGKVSKVSLPGHRVNVDDDGSFFIAFARTAPRSETMTITLSDGTRIQHQFQVAQRTYETDRIDGLPEDEVKLDAADRQEKGAEDARIQAVRMKNTDSDCAEQGFVWPAKGRITSRYGQPRILNGTDGGIHWGVDLAVPVGTPVAAPACGTVVFAEADVKLSGGTLVIDHGQGVTSTFLHLAGFTKKVGDVVKKGEVVARSGATGRATGAHLDWRMNFFEVRIDPELLVQPQPGTM